MRGTTIATIGDLIDGGYDLWATCRACGTRQVDLAMVAERYGRAATFIRPASPIRFRCQRCGGRSREAIIIPKR